MAKLTSMHFYAWKKGLKTGMYYLRTRAAVDAIKFTVDTQALEKKQQANTSTSSPSKLSSSKGEIPQEDIEEDGPVCRMEEGCVVCGS